MYSHYLQITLKKSSTKLRPDYLASELLQQLHHFNLQQKPPRLAISFPEINEERNHIGYVFRLFGKPEILEAFINMPGMANLFGKKDCHMALPKSVPESVNRYISYVRDRRQEKQTPAAMRRTEERAIRRAMEGKNKQLVNAQDIKTLRENLITARSTLSNQPTTSISMNSSSTGQPFFIKIRSVPCDQEQTGGINSYGLSNTEKVTLPHF